MAQKKTKILGAAAGAIATAAAAGAVGVAVARRRNAEPEVWQVRPGPDGWVVKRDGGNDQSTHATKKEAVSAGRRTAAERAPSTLVLHYADGRVQKRLTYDGKD